MAKTHTTAMSKNEEPKAQSVTVYLSGDVIARIKDEAARDDRSVSYIVNKILEEHYQKTDKTK
jgi:predicted DNA binding CopG/RHH family protein